MDRGESEARAGRVLGPRSWGQGVSGSRGKGKVTSVQFDLGPHRQCSGLTLGPVLGSFRRLQAPRPGRLHHGQPLSASLQLQSAPRHGVQWGLSCAPGAPGISTTPFPCEHHVATVVGVWGLGPGLALGSPGSPALGSQPGAQLSGVGLAGSRLGEAPFPQPALWVSCENGPGPGAGGSSGTC